MNYLLAAKLLTDAKIIFYFTIGYGKYQV